MNQKELLNYFAAKALPTLLMESINEHNKENLEFDLAAEYDGNSLHPSETAKLIAGQCFVMAQAMLDEGEAYDE